MVIRANVDMFPYARKYADMFPCARKIVSMFFSQSGCACSVVCLCKSTTRATLYNRTDWHSFQGLNRCANCLTAHPRATPIVISRGFYRGFYRRHRLLYPLRIHRHAQADRRVGCPGAAGIRDGSGRAFNLPFLRQESGSHQSPALGRHRVRTPD